MSAGLTTHRRRPAAPALLVLALLAGCAGSGPARPDAATLIAQGRVEEGLAEMERQVREHPDHLEDRIALVRQRELALNQLLGRADADRQAGRLDAAESGYQRAAALAPEHARVRGGMDALRASRGRLQKLDQATAALAQGRAEDAAALVRPVLDEQPDLPRAIELMKLAEAAQRARQAADAASRPATASPAAQAAAAAAAARRTSLRKPVSLDFRDASLKAVFEALARSTGMNFVFDREVRNDIKITLSINDMSVDEVVDVITTTHQLGRKRLNEQTVLIYPNTPAKQRDYLDLSVRTFYLANADARAMMTMLKTVLKSRDLYADEKLNSITLRDTPEAIRLAEQVVAAQDLPEPEVMLDVEVLEIKRSRLSDIGIDLPGKFSVLNIVKNPDTVVSTATGLTTIQNNTTTTTQLTLDKLRGLRGASIGIDSPAVNLRAENGDTNILANPRIRVKNRDKARVLIGDRVPVITTTAAANVGVSESVSYLDVGLKLEVEPNVFLDNEVAVKVNLEVSNVVREVKGRSGSLTYQVGTRLASTTLRLKDGETQALAGLISDEDRRSAAGVPGLLELPLLGRLFSTERSDRSKTEIVLLLTPRVIRNLGPAGGPNQVALPSGTEAMVGAPRLTVGPGRVALQAASGAGAAAAGAAAAPPGTATPDVPDVPDVAPETATQDGSPGVAR